MKYTYNPKCTIKYPFPTCRNIAYPLPADTSALEYRLFVYGRRLANFKNVSAEFGIADPQISDRIEMDYAWKYMNTVMTRKMNLLRILLRDKLR